MFQQHTQRLKTLYAKYERWVPIVAFGLGFIVDMLMLHRIDQPDVIIQQAVYLIVVAMLLGIELISSVRDISPPRLMRAIWGYREFLLHFALGTLLNSYTIFYFKSASGLTSFIFVFILIAALTISEFKRFGHAQHQVHMALWSLSLISFFQSLLPILFGFMGVIPFLASGLISLLVFLLFYKFMRPRLAAQPDILRTRVLYPYLGVHLLFTALYFTHAIPPVPLSVQYIGIYHSIEKRDGQYQLGYTRPGYKFWQHGDETFQARAGDTVVAFVQIFSPGGFKDQLKFRWSLFDDSRGWLSQDAIPLTVTGGRDEGFRAYTKKANYQPGKWRLQIETLDEREVGRLTFHIVQDDSNEERKVRTDIR